MKDILEAGGIAHCKVVPITIAKKPDAKSGEAGRGVGAGQIALSRGFAAEHASAFRYCDALGGWLAWDGARWRRDEVGAADEAAKVWLALASQGESAKDAAKLCSRGSLEAVLGLAKSDPLLARPPAAFDTSHDEINTPAGVVDLRTGAVRKHDRDHFTRVTAAGVGGSCPRFLRFLEEVQPDPEVRMYLQRFAGYAATGRSTEQVLGCWYGRGANGKSVFADILTRVLGDYAAPGASSLLVETRGTHPTDVAHLRGLRCAYVSETEGGAKLDVDKVKRLTGGELLTARLMGKDFFTFAPTHTLLMITNHRPLVDASDDAIWRRLHLVPFDVAIAKDRQDRNLAARIIEEEGSGVLAWVLEGAVEWYRRGLDAPPTILDATRSYRLDEDVIGRFIEERCVVAPTARALPTHLWAAFQRFVKDEGGEDRRVTGRDFFSALDRKGFRSTKSNGTRWRVGLDTLDGGADENERRVS